MGLFDPTFFDPTVFQTGTFEISDVCKLLPDTILVDMVGNPYFPDNIRRGVANYLVYRRDVTYASQVSLKASLTAWINNRSAQDEVFERFFENALAIPID